MNENDARESDSALADDKRLKLKRNGAISGAVCPHCQCPMGPQDVLCLKCGYNLQTGTLTQTGSAFTPRRRRKAIPLHRLLVWAVLIAGTYWTWRHPEQTRSFYFERVRPWYYQQLHPWVQRLRPVPAPEVPAGDAVLPPGPVSADRAALEDRIRVELQREFPLLMPGEKAEFVNLKGQRSLAVYLGMRDELVVLRLEDGRVISDRADKLNEASRLRCDPAFREAYVQKKAAR